MKKTFWLFAPAVMFLAGTFSCTKEESEITPTDGELIEIVGTHEEFVPMTRTQLGNNIVSWSADDLITVWAPEMAQSSQFSMVSTSGMSAKFEGNAVGGNSQLRAFYPAEWQPVFSETAVSFDFPEEMPGCVNGLGDDANPSFAMGNPSDMTFQNICGLLRFNVSGTQELRSILFKTIGGEALSGPAEISISGEKPELRMTGTDNARKMTVETLLTEEAQTFYLPLPPGEYSGFEISLGDATGDEYTFTYDGTATVIERGAVTDLPVEVKYLDSLGRKAGRLDADGTANCYIVTAPGTYYFNCTVKGSTDKPVGEAVSAHIVWSEKADLISGLSVEDGNLIFSAGAGAGNTVVAVTDADGTILWSWHIWCTGGEVPVDKTMQNYTGKTMRIMDRNLGAWSETGWQATLYQWGRKDPFTNAEEIFVDGEKKDIYSAWYSLLERDEAGADNNEIITYITQHPGAYITGSGVEGWLQTHDRTLWGDPDGWEEMYAYDMSSFSGAKTEYDPCPAGYRVPNVWTFTGFTKDGLYANMMIDTISLVDQAWEGGWWFKLNPDDTEGVFFPGTGYWVSYKNKVWDPDGTYFYREGLTRYSYYWLASPLNMATGNAGCLRLYYESEVNCGCYPQYNQWGDYAIAVRCVRDDYNY